VLNFLLLLILVLTLPHSACSWIINEYLEKDSKNKQPINYEPFQCKSKLTLNSSSLSCKNLAHICTTPNFRKIEKILKENKEQKDWKLISRPWW
jgi:hypothetical protein